MAKAFRIWRDGADDTEVPLDEAVEAWTTAAVEILERVASRYDAAITEGELDAKVQDRARLHTTMRSREVSERVVERLVHRSTEAGAAPLASLVVRRDGGVAAGYRSRRHLGDGAAGDREGAADEDRLECYRAFAGDVPDGAAPRPSAIRRARDERALARQAARPGPERAGAVCPNCHLQTRADGTCESCA